MWCVCVCVYVCVCTYVPYVYMYMCITDIYTCYLRYLCAVFIADDDPLRSKHPVSQSRLLPHPWRIPPRALAEQGRGPRPTSPALLHRHAVRLRATQLHRQGVGREADTTARLQGGCSGQVRSGQVRVFNVHIQSKLL